MQLVKFLLLPHCRIARPPERNWDDIKGADLKGKVLLVEINEPGNRPGGSFDGVVTASLDPAWYAGLYGQVELGREGLAFLTGLDGSVRARSAAASASRTNLWMAEWLAVSSGRSTFTAIRRASLRS